MITTPRSNVIFSLVYYATGADVDTVVVDGRVVMEGRRVLTLDERDILTRLQQRSQKLWERAEQPKPCDDP
jgi:5-methylthioadenosine/S-adenosylhomocysteine deaminase